MPKFWPKNHEILYCSLLAIYRIRLKFIAKKLSKYLVESEKVYTFALAFGTEVTRKV